MWAFRKAFVRIKFQPFSSVTFCAKSETSNSSYTYNTGFNELPPHISDRSITLKRLYSQNSFVGKHSFSSKHDATVDVVEGNNESNGEVISEADQFEYKDDIAEERRASTRWFNLTECLYKIREEGIDLTSKNISVKDYKAVLDSCVFNDNVTKAELVFNEIINRKLSITSFACKQMLNLYKRTGDRKKMIDVLVLMKKENIKPSLVMYKLLIDTQAQSGDLVEIEQILEDMKGQGLKPDKKFQAALAGHYVNLGIIEKAKAVLKEMEGHNLNENRGVCSYLLPIYASLGSLDDVKRVWEVCETNPHSPECLSAIDAFGKLKKVEEAEAVFDKMSKKWKQLGANHYTAMLKVYANNKMFSEGKNVVKRMMNVSGCGIGRESLNALVKFYIEADEVEQAGSVLIMRSMRSKRTPFETYLIVLEEYAKRGDVCNAEKIIKMMKHDGYPLRYRLYSCLLKAYINSKTPAYGFRLRMKASGIIPTKFMEAQLAQVDAFKETVVLD